MSTATPHASDIADVGLLNTAEIKRRRLDLDLSQDEAATRAGMAGGKTRWADIENNRRANITLATLEAVARALNCDPADLLVRSKPGQ